MLVRRLSETGFLEPIFHAHITTSSGLRLEFRDSRTVTQAGLLMAICSDH